MAVWFDVTSLYSWNRPVTGVTRVELECARALLESEEHRVQFVQLEPRSKQFISSDPLELRERLAFLESLEGRSSGRLRPFLKMLLGLLPDRMQTILLSVLSIPQRFIERLRFARLGETVSTKSNVIHSGDCLISLGFGLASERFKALAILRQQVDIRIVGCCYDLIPWIRPDLTLDRITRSFVRYLGELLEVSDHVVCISDCTASDLQLFLESKSRVCPISVIRLGSQIGQRRPNSTAAAIAPILEQPFVLYVSTLERRKNHEILLDAYRELLSQGFTNLPLLVFVGMQGWGADHFFQRLAAEPDLARYVALLHHVSDNDLAVLYQKTLFTVYPSLYEGWGLPVAESLAHGKFCIASNAASIPEVGGELVHYCSPEDASAWALAIHHFASHPDALAVAEEKVQRHYEPPQWRETVNQIMHVARASQEVLP